MIRLIDPLYEKLGYDTLPNEDHLTIILRKLVVEWACKLGHPECVRQASSQYSKWMNMSDPDNHNP